MKKKNAAISSVIGGLFALAVIVLGITAFLYIGSLENNVYQSANSAALVDSQKNQESLAVSNLFFGGTQTYIPSSTYVASAPCVSVCGLTMNTGASLRWDGQTKTTLNTLYAAYAPFNLTSSTTTAAQESISNMNLTSSSSGWIFTTQSSNLVGGFSSILGNPIPGSGLGSLFISAAYSSGSTFTSNLTTRFFNDLADLGTFTSAQFSWARYVPAHAFTNSKANTFTINVYLLDETVGSTYTVATVTYSSGDNSFVYTTGITALTNGTSIVSRLSHTGYYDIIIATSIKFLSSTCGTSCLQFLSYFDDVGLQYSFNSYVTDWTYTYVTSQSPTSAQSLSFSVSTSYNQTYVVQQIYLFDYGSSKYDFFSDIIASTSTTTVQFTVGITNTGQYSVQNYLNSAGKVIIRVISATPTVKATGGHMEVDVPTVNSLSLSISFASSGSLTFTVRNNGPIQMELISLIILDSSGHHYYDSTTSPSFDVVLYPQQSQTISFTYNWLPGVTTIELLTTRGNLYTLTGSSS